MVASKKKGGKERVEKQKMTVTGNVCQVFIKMRKRVMMYNVISVKKLHTLIAHQKHRMLFRIFTDEEDSLSH